MKTSTAIAVTAICCALAAATAPAAPASGTAVLFLENGVAPAAENQWPGQGRDFELELTLKDGKWLEEAWGYALWFNRADHDGKVVRIEGNDTEATLEVEMTLWPDKWYPPAPGKARYTLKIQRDGTGFTGTYTGAFEYPVKGGEHVKSAVEGKVTGGLYPSYMQPAEGFEPLKPGEHPRLIFRKSDLPALRKQLETPEGKAMLQRFLARLDKDLGGSPKVKAMYPAGYALAYQLTGDKKYADQARQLLDQRIIQPRLGGSQDIHFGPIAMATALTYDLCYDAWDEAWRTTVATFLEQRMRDLASGRNIGNYAPNPWSNHNGVRVGSAGVAALALWGEKDGLGNEIKGLDRILRILARDTRRYFWYGGLGQSGWCLEGAFYKRMTWNSGPGHFIHAWRTAMGANLIADWPGAYSILGEWMEAPPSNSVPRFGVGDHQASGLWPVGLTTVPAEWAGGAKWLYDRSYGLKGDGSWGAGWAYQIGYAMTAYPFAAEAVEPGKAMPWVAEDPRQGHWIFRRPWEGGNDFLMVNHLRSMVMPGCHYERSGRTGDMQIFALGKQWVGEPNLTENLGPGAALPATGAVPKIVGNILQGIHTTAFRASPDGKAIHSMDLSPAYLEDLAKGQKPPAGARTVSFARGGTYIDHGVRASRHLAIDVSGSAGAPVLIAWLDTFEGGKGVNWRLQLARDAGKVAQDGNTITVGDPAGKNMKLTFITPGEIKLTGGLTVGGGDTYFVILTIQDGAAPAVKVDGAGADAKVTVGNQTVHFDGKTMVLGR